MSRRPQALRQSSACRARRVVQDTAGRSMLARTGDVLTVRCGCCGERDCGHRHFTTSQNLTESVNVSSTLEHQRNLDRRRARSGICRTADTRPRSGVTCSVRMCPARPPLVKFNRFIGGNVSPTVCRAGRSLLEAHLHVTCLHCLAPAKAASTARGPRGLTCPVRGH